MPAKRPLRSGLVLPGAGVEGCPARPPAGAGKSMAWWESDDASYWDSAEDGVERPAICEVLLCSGIVDCAPNLGA